MQAAWNFNVRASADLQKAITDGFVAQASELSASADESGIGEKARNARLANARSILSVAKKVAVLANAARVLEIDVYDVIGDGWFYGLSARYMRDVLRYSGDADVIRLRINSDGGSAMEAFAIYNLLVAHRGGVEVQVDGRACSAASVIAMAGDKITMMASSWMMIHCAAGYAEGDPQALRDWADVLDKITAQAADIYAARTKLSAERVLELMKAETWMTAAEAKALGFADVVEPLKSKPSENMRSLATMRLEDFKNVPDELRATIEAARLSATSASQPSAVLKAVPYKKYPLDEDSSWDAAAAVERIRKWASSDDSGDEDKIDWSKYRRAFTWYDDANAETFGAYKLPHHDVVDGELKTVRAGVIAAGNAVNGARGGVDIPEDELPAVRAHLAKHYAEWDAKAPWDEEARAPARAATLEAAAAPGTPAPAAAQPAQAAQVAAPSTSSQAAPAAVGTNPTAGGGKKRTKAMDLKTLMAEHPELFAAVKKLGSDEGVKLGVEQERKRCNAHVKMATKTGAVDIAHKAIESGADLSDQEVIADYMSASMNRGDRNARQTETAAATAATAGAPAAAAAAGATAELDYQDRVVAAYDRQQGVST